MFTTVNHSQFHDARNLLTKTNATRAVNAPTHLRHRDEWTNILVQHHPFLLFVARGGSAVTHGKILQLALTALIANRAVQGMVNQQKLHDRLLGLDGFVALGAYDHPLRNGRGTCRHGLRRLFNVHKAHSAICRNGKFFVVTEMGNISAGFFCSMHHHAAFSDFYLLTVEFYFNHIFSLDQADNLAGCVAASIFASNSDRKCLIIARTGIAAASPRAQIVRPIMFTDTSSSKVMSSRRPCPC